jgi:hypothetical protein
MSKISLTAQQKAILNPIKERGGYSTITAVVGALIAIYGDDLLWRVSLPPTSTLPVPTATPSSPNSALTQSPITAPLDPNTAPNRPNSALAQNTVSTSTVPTSTPSSPKRTKFDL